MQENDYLFGTNKIGGNAQSIIKDRWAHHTSFLWDYKPERMNYLQVLLLSFNLLSCFEVPVQELSICVSVLSFVMLSV